jgi:hypothetical protein
MLEAVNVPLEARGIRIATGTIVDATILHAPSSTKNASGERDPEMYQTRKGNQWYFGLKAHIGGAWCIRYVRPLRQWRTSKCCPTYCTERSVRYGATVAIGARRIRSTRPRRTRRI